MGSRTSRIAGVYFAAQGVGVAAWWALLLTRPDLHPLFFGSFADSMALSKFFVPDVLVMGGSSLVAGWLVLRGSHHGRPATMLAVGAVTYGLVGAIAVNWPIGSRPLADELMVASMIGTLWAAWQVRG